MSQNTDGRAAGRSTGPMTLSVENLGGIDSCEVSFDAGVTILTGRNATNRTSLLRAIGGALGGGTATLKSDAEHGRVELDVGGERCVREYERRGEAVVARGDPYTEDAALVDHLVALLRDNPVRRAVEGGGENLRDVLLEPVDTDAIQRRIGELERERDRVDRQISDLEAERAEVPKLERRRTSLESDLESVESDLEAARETVAAADADREAAEEAEEHLEELNELRQRLRQTDDRIDHQHETLADLREDRAEVEAELESLTVEREELADVESELDRLRRRKRELGATVDDLTRVVEFNESVLSGETDLPTGDDDVTDELDPGSGRVVCWTCESEVERQDVERRLDTMRELAAEKRERRGEIDAKIESLTERERDLERAETRRDELRGRREELDRKIDHREEKLATLEADREELRAEIEAVESRTEEVDAPGDGELFEAYQRISELEYERGRIKERFRTVSDRLAEADEAAEELAELRERREELGEELTSLRSRIEEIERDAVERFNDHVASVLEVLGYRNVARVWIERRTDADGVGDEAAFELHLVRENDDGEAYPDTVDNLSESERKVVGLVVALAGYLVHEVHETVPMMLLDSVEAIDADRIAALVDYFAEHVPYLVVALLPEDERALPAEHERIPASDLSE